MSHPAVFEDVSDAAHARHRSKAGRDTDPMIRYATVNGVRLRYVCSEGEGVPLLLCNGIGANLEIALPLIRALHGIPTVLFDVPGVGGSDNGLFLPRMSSYARFAVGLMDQLGFTSEFHVAGVSWGGALAQQIARQYRKRVTRQILAATSPGVTMFPGKLSALRHMITPQRYLSPNYMAAYAGVIYGGQTRARAERGIEHAEVLKPPSTQGYFQQMLAGSRFTSLFSAPCLKTPTLVMYGDEDPLVRPINAKLLAALYPNSQLHCVEGGGHLFLVEAVRESARVMRGFLRP